MAIDHDPHYLAQARRARDHFPYGDRVDIREITVYDHGDLTEQFHIVLFLGVLYHHRHPLLGLDLVADRVGDDTNGGAVEATVRTTVTSSCERLRTRALA